MRGRIFRSNQCRPFRKSGAFKQGEIIDLDDWEDNKSPKKRAKPVRHEGGIVCISDDEEDNGSIPKSGRMLY